MDSIKVFKHGTEKIEVITAKIVTVVTIAGVSYVAMVF